MAEGVDVPDDPRVVAEGEAPGDGGPGSEAVVAVTPPRRFYANLADL